MVDTPSVSHPQVRSIELLSKLPSFWSLNNLPFRFLHPLALAVFLYFYLTHHLPAEGDGSELAANSTLLDSTAAPEALTTLDELDELDAVVQPTEEAASEGAANETTIEGPVLWEPKHPQDYVRVVWAFIIVFHALANLFCVWFVRFRIFCQYKRVKTLEEADHVLCIPPPNHGTADIVPLHRRDITVDELSV